jgi:hypothetical protein
MDMQQINCDPKKKKGGMESTFLFTKHYENWSVYYFLIHYLIRIGYVALVHLRLQLICGTLFQLV